MSMLDNGNLVKRVRDNGTVSYGYTSAKPSRTKQAMQAECDINNIMKRYQNTGLVSHVSRHQGRYEDVSQGLDYQESLALVQRAQDAFMSLPASIRSQFDNDPGTFLSFVENPANADKMREMGLLKVKPVPDPVAVRVVGEPAGSAGSDKPTGK